MGVKRAGGDGSRLRSLAEMCTNILPPQSEPLCCGHQRLSPAIGQGLENDKGFRGRRVRVTGYSSLNVDGPCIHDSVHGVSNRECTI